MMTTVCPNCDASLKAPDAVEGKRVKCKKCGEAFTARRADADFLEEADDKPVKPTVKMSAVKAKPKSKAARDEDEPPRKSNKSAAKPDDDNDEEEAPKPKLKKKGKGKKKQAKSPVLLFVLIGLGALVLIGGGIGVYFAFFADSDSSKPTTPSAKGGPAGPSAVSRPGGNSITSGWVAVDDRDGGFQLSFPKQPKKEVKPDDSPPFGQLDTTSYLAAEPGELFIAEYVKIPSDRQGLTDDQILDAVYEDGQKKALERNSELKDFRKMTYQSFPACEFSFTAMVEKGSLQFNVRIIVAKGKVFDILSAGAVPASHAPRSKAFFDSLKID